MKKCYAVVLLGVLASFLLIAIPEEVYASCGTKDTPYNPISRIEGSVGKNWVNPEIVSSVGDGRWLTVIRYEHVRMMGKRYTMTAYVIGYKIVGKKYVLSDENDVVVDIWAERQYSHRRWLATRGRITYEATEKLSLEDGSKKITEVRIRWHDTLDSIIDELVVKNYDDLKHLSE